MGNDALKEVDDLIERIKSMRREVEDGIASLKKVRTAPDQDRERKIAMSEGLDFVSACGW